MEHDVHISRSPYFSIIILYVHELVLTIFLGRVRKLTLLGSHPHPTTTNSLNMLDIGRHDISLVLQGQVSFPISTQINLLLVLLICCWEICLISKRVLPRNCVVEEIVQIIPFAFVDIFSCFLPFFLES